VKCGNSLCSYFLGDCFLYGKGNHPNPSEAFPLIFVAAHHHIPNEKLLFYDCIYRCFEYHEINNGNFSIYDFYQKHENDHSQFLLIFLNLLTAKKTITNFFVENHFYFGVGV
jgi:hypothetical protein